MADDSIVIEGTVKFRDGKKWKSRWCVMRKLSPVADSLQLQLWRDARARRAGAGSKAALALQQFVGCETGFTLDKHSHTLALVCRDFVAVLAFETRERLMQWQVKVSAHVGEARQYLVQVAGGRRLAAGPARLHVRERGAALTAGVPPRLLGLWELHHLRRYGVVEGRFCFEGGSQCGKGAGLHVLLSDRAHDIARDFSLAAQGRLSPRRRPFNLKKSEDAESPKSHKSYRPDTRLSELNTVDQSLSSIDRLYEDPCVGEQAGGLSPYWPSTESRGYFHDLGLADTASVHEVVEGSSTSVTLERCMSCFSKLGALSRSSTAALTPGAKHFSPAWTMEAVHESKPTTEEITQLQGSHKCAVEERNQCAASPALDHRPTPTIPPVPGERPTKPSWLNLRKAQPGPVTTCACTRDAINVGPYENYDVPKLPSSEVEGEYYDTPKRLKECLNSELFKVTRYSYGDTMILKKPCGCLLQFRKKTKEPTIVDTEENLQQTNNCACQRVTDWAQNWIKLPYCRRNTTSSDNLVPNKENLIPNIHDRNALYATIDVSRKTRRKIRPSISHDGIMSDCQLKNVDPRRIEIDDGPLAHYENLSFALSLEHYENAKDILKKAGMTQSEIDAIKSNLKSVPYTAATNRNMCTKCGHLQVQKKSSGEGTTDDYLMMEPNTMESTKPEQNKYLPAGYTPMSPIGFAFHTLKHPARSPIKRLLEEKSASNPTLCGPDEGRPENENGRTGSESQQGRTASNQSERIDYRKRSSSADSSRFLEDVKEGSVGSHGSTSSIETLRNMVAGAPGADHKLSDADSSEASKGARGCGATSVGGAVPPAGNRDSSSSNDSGVSSWSMRGARPARRAFTPRTTLRRSRSSGPPPASSAPFTPMPAKSSSAEAEVPILTVKQLRGIIDTHSTSSGTSDMSDYIETLSICSSHSSTDTPITMRAARHTTSTLRPRSGAEYRDLRDYRTPVRPARSSGPQPAGSTHPGPPLHLPHHRYVNLP